MIEEEEEEDPGCPVTPVDFNEAPEEQRMDSSWSGLSVLYVLCSG